MAKRTGGFIGQDGINAPDPATGVSASGDDASASISFTSPSDQGGADITGYRVQSNDGIGASGSSSPITVTGLTNGTSYTFNVWAINPFGWSSPSDASGSVIPALPERAFIAGGYSGGSLQQIDVITITSTGNATDFGDLSAAEYQGGCSSSITRAIIGGGDATNTNILYFTLSSGGATGTFGNLNQRANSGVAGASNSTRGLVMGGNYFNGSNTVWLNNIQYVTIASTGNSADFGDLTVARDQTTATSNSTRAVTAGGRNGSNDNLNTIDYSTIATAGNAIDFGNLSSATRRTAGAASSTRGVFAGGTTSGSNEIQYVTLASTGNTSDFGDLTVARQELGGTSGTTRSVFCGGGGGTNVIDYITTASTSNATDFGDLAQAREQASQTTSNAHGGLQ